VAGFPIAFDSSDTITNGGISLQPVEATIAKAQATEQFQAKIIPSLGLSTDLESLAKYADDIVNEITSKEDGDLDLAEVDDDEIESVSIWYNKYWNSCCYMYTVHKDVTQP